MVHFRTGVHLHATTKMLLSILSYLDYFPHLIYKNAIQIVITLYYLGNNEEKMSTYPLQVQVYFGILSFSDWIHLFTENTTHRERSVCIDAQSGARQTSWQTLVLDFCPGKVASLWIRHWIILWRGWKLPPCSQVEISAYMSGAHSKDWYIPQESHSHSLLPYPEVGFHMLVLLCF